ncbi:gliding motility-associated C-terminal domain-containing protein [Mucilaginibacter sp. OK098]|uniref:gliding motility-associated C-terminal domain-containing protein n=1 Tax=Mucilaginibacter sp. OK098 TaxID=1855297 RepID=UPI0009206311|nr:gliding motility-associated C-terminal domain-containing protein [Mucilaginibacter sp. OK098]SHM96367.1 gliding motility-associated C-terminal domain-containing protein [Mucilaginibacter sp. OK098]
MFKPIVIIFLLIGFKAFSQTPNIGFENGSFSNWNCYIGFVDPSGNVSLFASVPINNRHTLISKGSAKILDPYGEFPVLCPNGSNYSIRLGNDDTSRQAERVSYTLKVPNQKSYSIVFNYAVVLENPNHLPFQQPKFRVQVYDVTDNKYLECPSFDFAASSSLPGFKLSTVAGVKGESIYYKDWSTAAIDLSNYTGKEIRLEFTTNDCTKGQHFGYAYLDINEDNGTSITGNAYCAGQRSMTLHAPNGFASYEWFTADLSKLVGTGQSINISPPPPDNTTYVLEISPYEGLGCTDTLSTIVNRIDEGFKLNVPDTLYGCPGKGVDLTDAKVTAGSSPGTTLSYYKDSLGTSYLYNPERITSSGLFYIQGGNKEGCMNILPVNVVVAEPEISVTNPKPVVFPVTVDLSKTFVHKKNETYSYYSNAEATIPVDNYMAIKYGAVFYIKVASDYGCSVVVPVNVVIEPPPLYTIIAPNTFTPNNDGINDNFSITVDGEATFGVLRIFNRYGKLVFTGKSQADYWNGNYNGQVLPVGTYYWVFEGTDNYHQTKISKASSIFLLR